MSGFDRLRCQRCGAAVDHDWTSDLVTAHRRRAALGPDGTTQYAETVDAVTACSWSCLAVLAAQHADGPSADAVVRVVCERERQRTVEGYSPERDTDLPPGELAQAGATYALQHAAVYLPPAVEMAGVHDAPPLWPWDADTWKPRSLDRDLVRAAALIAAEADRDRTPPPTVDVAPF